MTQDEEAVVQYKSHQAHRREQEAKGKKGENHRGVYEEERETGSSGEGHPKNMKYNNKKR